MSSRDECYKRYRAEGRQEKNQERRRLRTWKALSKKIDKMESQGRNTGAALKELARLGTNA